MTGSTRSRAVRLRVIALFAAALSTGCAAGAKPAADPGAHATVEQRIAEARAEGLVLENPLEIDESMKKAAARMVNRNADPARRLRNLARFLTDSGFVNFEYTQNQSLTAKQAYQQRRGDCMAYTNLFLALARALGIDAYFVHVREVQNYYERAGWFFVSSHVAVGYGVGPAAEVIDFANEISDWRLALYSIISDDAALALYYNNVAVDHMVSGRTEDAEHLFRFWLAREPSVAELYNNLGVLLNRQKRYKESLPVLAEAIRRFPTYAPLFTNGLAAARGAGRTDLVSIYEERGAQAEYQDPFFIFARAMSFYHDDRYAQAAALLERARDVKPDSPVILAWLTRAYLAGGKREKGLETFEKVKALGPTPDVIKDLKTQFPDLP